MGIRHVLAVLVAFTAPALAQSPPAGQQYFTWPGAGALTGAEVIGPMRQSGADMTTTILAIRHGHRSIDDYSPAANCSTDDAPKFVQAMAQVAADGGGELEIGPHCYAVSTLAIPAKVKLIGHWYEGSQSYSSYFGGPYTLAVASSGTIAPGSNSAIEGLIVMRQGLTLPTTLRQGVVMVAAFAGTGINVPAQTLDVSLRHLAIFGFAKGIDMPVANIQRVSIEDVIADNTAGMTFNNCHDICRVTSGHFFPFLTANFGWSINTQQAVTGAVSSGGAVQITSATPHGLVTGDVVNVHDVVGVPAANGRFTVTVVDASNVILVGTTFAGAFGASPSSGIGIDINRRTGVGIEVFNSETTSISNSFAYDYTTGIHVGAGAGWTQVIGDSADGPLLVKDPTTTGLLVDGTAYGTSVIGGSFQAAGTAAIFNSSATTGTTVVGATLNPGASANPYAVQHQLGRLTMTGNQTGIDIASQMYVADAITSLVVTGNDLPWPVVASATAAAKMMGAGNNFGPGTPFFGNFGANNVSAGQFVNSVASIASGGTNCATAPGTPAQRVYVPTVAAGSAISITTHNVGADVVLWNGGANALTVCLAGGTGTINGAASVSLAAGLPIRLNQITATTMIAW